ncbi:probable ATP-dependent RNA helicase DDX47 [Copidosoma floridanum]|uniref:probable ATP-dependent RNA helicase DDX47 n=1 Tax=Copidosoma floridanum TaxID=29053 RepID=UPI0006C9D2BC|nr:probable ATP-dependent RNA helicase DDX47 [Copidosoma floridanum]
MTGITDKDVPKEPTKLLTWKDLGLADVLCRACENFGWKAPTKIQSEAIPLALKGKDIIGLAETGSGKTAAFALPILHALLKNPQKFFALILTPTRELAMQIHDQFEKLGANVGLQCALLMGGDDMIKQTAQLAKKPHVIIATTGRMLDHLNNTKGFSLKSLKYLVMDEADKMLSFQFEEEVNEILERIPKERRTFLFSATMTNKVENLQRASLKNPVKVSICTKYQTVDTLNQYYIFIPARLKDVYLTYILQQLSGNNIIVFCNTCDETMRVALLMNNLGFMTVALYGKMSQNKRTAALAKFKERASSILVSTDVASRGIDIEHVDVVVNYDMPIDSKNYIHRVGRTARAGRSGNAISFLTQYNAAMCGAIETLIEKKLVKYETKEEDVLLLQQRVVETQHTMQNELKEIKEEEQSNKRKINSDSERDDVEVLGGIKNHVKRRKKGKKKNK